MFYDGTLEAGIGKALREQRHVVCFVSAPDNPESLSWENDFLADEDASSGIGPHAQANRSVTASSRSKLVGCPSFNGRLSGSDLSLCLLSSLYNPKYCCHKVR